MMRAVKAEKFQKLKSFEVFTTPKAGENVQCSN